MSRALKPEFKSEMTYHITNIYYPLWAKKHFWENLFLKINQSNLSWYLMLIPYYYMFSFIWDLLTLSLFRKSEFRKSRDYRRKNSVVTCGDMPRRRSLLGLFRKPLFHGRKVKNHFLKKDKIQIFKKDIRIKRLEKIFVLAISSYNP